MMSDDELKKRLEKDLLESDPAQLIREKKDAERHEDLKKQAKESSEKLGLLLGDLKKEIAKYLSGIPGEISKSVNPGIEGHLKTVLEALNIINDNSISTNGDIINSLSELKEIMKLVSQKELSVTVQAPEAKILDKTKVVHETVVAKATNEILMKILQYTMKQQGEGIIIKNTKPDQAIPTRLVDRTGRDFYDAIGNAIIPGIAGGVPQLPLNTQIPLTSKGVIVRPTVAQDEIRLGRVQGASGWTKFAYADLSAAGGYAPIWASSSTFTYMTTSSTFTISYNNVVDGLGTTGALTLVFFYVDENGEHAIGTHVLGNTGSDVTSFSGLGINRIAVIAGSAGFNADDITVTETTGATVQAVVPAEGSVTQQAIFFCGNNAEGVAKLLSLKAAKPSGGGNAKIEIRGYVRNRLNGTRYEVFRDFINTAVRLDSGLIEPIGFALNSSDILYFEADSDANGVNLIARFSLNHYEFS